MNVDAHARRIDVAVREAIELSSARVGGVQPLGHLRARWGSEAHARYRRLHEARGARGEVDVQLQRSHGDWVVKLHGRADIVTTTNDGLVVDEVKSTLGHADRADALLDPHALAAAKRQALLLSLIHI